MNVSADEFLGMLPQEHRAIVHRIRQEKLAGSRAKPSERLFDGSSLLLQPQRREILDRIAGLVDENLTGRSDMCSQFADLLARALIRLKLPARPVLGMAIYYDGTGKEIYRWDHAWVRIGEEVIDGNVDSLSENPMVPPTVRVDPYWGPLQKVPAGRRLRGKPGETLKSDNDVLSLWWPELQEWLDKKYPSCP